MQLRVEMRGPQLYVARIEPYRLSDLDRLLGIDPRSPRWCEIAPIGKTVGGRDLEIVRIGNPGRALSGVRAGAGASVGVRQQLGRAGTDPAPAARDASAKTFLETYSVYILPMANKDGVARGGTRFNLLGKDLNRNWDKPADPRARARERRARALARVGDRGRAPRRTSPMELHNDGGGRLHISRPPVPQLERHLARMAILEELLRKHTWFTEGSTQSGVPQQRHARRRLAPALRHRRRRPRAELQLDRRAQGVRLGAAVDGVRREARRGLPRLLHACQALT